MSEIRNIQEKTKLKDEKAQLLREKGKIFIGDIEVNLWQHHTFDSVHSQQGWNNVKSYTKLNSRTDGINGDLVFSGVFQIPRKEVLDYAIQLGFKVHQNVSKNTDFVIVGSENVSPSKVSKALKLNEEKGADIRFIDENTFLLMVEENLFIPNNNIIENSIIPENNPPFKDKKRKLKTKDKLPSISVKLEGLIFVVSGVFTKFSRDELKNTIEQNGGKVSSSISKKTSYIVAGENMGPSKLAKAEKLEVKIIDESEFIKLLA